MGRFDLDSLLSELGVKRSAALEDSASTAAADQPGGPGESDASPEVQAEESRRGETEPAALSHTMSSTPPPATRAFVRNDPRETPRPPDASGRGLNAEVDPARVAEKADRLSLRPDDALGLLWGPTDGQRAAVRGRDLGAELQARGIITGEQLTTMRTVLRQSPGRTASEVLLEMGVPEEQIQQVVAQIHGLEFARINPDDGFHSSYFERLGADFCRRHGVLPLRKDGPRLIVGTVYPDDVFVIDEVRRLLGVSAVRQVIVTSSDINLIIEVQSAGEEQDIAVNDILADIDEGDVEVVENDQEDVDFAKQAGESPVIRYVNFIIQTALKEGASDIHIEPAEKKLKVRFRIDGILFDMMNPPHKMHAAIISRLKIMANLDISERRLPQDGRIRAVVAGRKLDLRVSTLPTVTGEKCVLRILDARSIAVGLEQLGFDETSLHIWRRQIKQPHGIILVTGPTGSGKTTTLYSSLREMDTKKLNVSTTEDPVEYHLDGITQVQIHDKIGMSFAAALRSLLRQDPDVVMVGEIRDAETARIAIQAALTGHLVLSTLHTNDAPSSVTRMINIGVEPFLIGAALNAVLAQRLVRRICDHCKTADTLNEEVQEFLMTQGLDAAQVSKGAGCDRCRQTGYAGRLGIYELLVLDDVTRDAIARSPSVTEFRRMCVERGMVTLRQDGLAKVVRRQTTIEEVLRVTEATI
ncbi:MAG: Flp pilus assembly complex ATPase component TadA [Phycisphaerales bacterium]|nr:Flp pilus assembly complex ATPase component TadA [Phycisphaerales bacterium]